MINIGKQGGEGGPLP